MPKTLDEIQTALATRYSGPVKMLQGRAYIPWDQAVKVANSILGPDTYDVEIQSYKMEEILHVQTGVSTYGYSAVVRLTVRPADSAPIVRDGMGFNELEFTGAGRAMIDPSIKGAASGGLLRALVLLGDAFGLFLYNDKDAPAPVQAGTTSTSSSRPVALGTVPAVAPAQANGTAKPALSVAQVQKLQNKGYSADLINQIFLMPDWKERRRLMDAVFAGATVDEVIGQFGLRNTVGAGVGGSGYPSELDEEDAF